MVSLCSLCTILGLVTLVSGQHLQFRLGSTSDSPMSSPVTDTPGVVTNPDSDRTSTLSYQSTQFPIWSSTTGPTSKPTQPTNGTTLTTSTPSPTSTVSPTNMTTTSTMTPTWNVTTTEQPTTPTVPVPTLPPEPVSPTVPWNVTYGPKGNYCVMLSFAARIDITYTNVLNEVVESGLDVPENATVNANVSSCVPGMDKEVFALDFWSPSSTVGTFKVVFNRNMSTNDSTIFEIKTTLLITEDLFPGIHSSYIGKLVSLYTTNLTIFDTESAHSYTCASLIKTNLTSVKVHDAVDEMIGDNNTVPFKFGTLETSNLKVQAFMPSDQKINTFLPDTVCAEDKSDISSSIPITVGVILLFMVVVVLIAYFIGRSRQQKATAEISTI